MSQEAQSVGQCAEKIPKRAIREITGRTYYYPLQCSRRAKAGSEYCWQHAPWYDGVPALQIYGGDKEYPEVLISYE